MPNEGSTSIAGTVLRNLAKNVSSDILNSTDAPTAVGDDSSAQVRNLTKSNSSELRNDNDAETTTVGEKVTATTTEKETKGTTIEKEVETTATEEELKVETTTVELDPETSTVEDDEGEDSEEEDPDCKDFPWKSFRLPRNVVPLSYNLTIHPNITTHNVTGSLAIDLKVLNSTKLIVLHAEDLVMTSFSMSVNGKRMEAEFYFCPDSSQWAFVMDETVEVGDVLDLGMDFQGEVLPDLQGLYITTHTDAKGKKTWVSGPQMRSAVTQFEPSYARKMFPCFDEPNFKATFEVSVVREPHHIVRSNMKLRLSEEHVDGLYIDVFHRTVKMSTYLLAIAILDNHDYVKRTTRNTQDPIEVRLYAPKDLIKGQSEFGLDTAIRALEYFEKYFNISYPLDKMDLLALDDFSEGAMENWGLVTFRDSTLLYSEESGSALVKEQIALIICHEVAHQWFGNLVTMDWWNDLWLNEGFANYMEFKCVDRLFPDWNIVRKPGRRCRINSVEAYFQMTRFYAENIAYSQEVDGLRSSRAVSVLTPNNTNIMGLFDAISYHKAAAIIRMLQSLSGERNFQRALVQYLSKYAYGNAKGSQLWKIVEKYATLPYGVSIPSMADSYITQMGYPMIYATLSRNEVTIYNQTRFFYEDGAEDDVEWPIPLHYRTSSQAESKLQWMKPDHRKVTWPLEERAQWVIVNTGGLSYVKVLYDKRNYAALAKQLRTNHSAISTIDRTMILSDAFEFAKTSRLSIGTYLDLLLYAEGYPMEIQCRGYSAIA
ncbi:peptidase family M1 [Ancylostoma duodenale]|uniref:Aminopeptidase n=1 Tax=Ancylostoma duodenale TaxID=51022 RepID=A0A0C2DWA8_9BILA|nr:peptidase family M1 [Ancylostoma duodenale]